MPGAGFDELLKTLKGLGDGEWAPGLLANPGMPSAGLQAAGTAFTQFAETLLSFAGARRTGDATASAGLSAKLEAAARDFFARVAPGWPTPPGAGSEWPMALQEWSIVLADIARATASAFAARFAAHDPPATLRATFDAWIDCAEEAFAAAAHSEAFARAQARLFNELVRVRARQQAFIEQASRSAGVPTRSEIDALHDELRRLRSELQERRVAPRKRPSRRTPR